MWVLVLVIAGACLYYCKKEEKSDSVTIGTVAASIVGTLMLGMLGNYLYDSYKNNVTHMPSDSATVLGTTISHPSTKDTAESGTEHSEEEGSNAATEGLTYTPTENITVISDAIQEKRLDVDPIKSNQVSAQNVNIDKYYDTLSADDQEVSYTFIASWEGVYRIDLEDMNSDMDVNIKVFDSNGYRIGQQLYCKNGGGLTLYDLSPGALYEIKLFQNSGLGSYTLSLKYPKALLDISDYTIVSDSIEYDDQTNIYSFSVQHEGLYRFEFSDVYEGNTFNIYAYDSLNKKIGSYLYCKNGNGITLENLCPGEKYELCVSQNSGYGSYKLNIGLQKESKIITGITQLTDSIEFTDQQNNYTFTPPIDGVYYFEFSGIQGNTYINAAIYNHLGERVSKELYCKNGSGITLSNASSEETYLIIISQGTGITAYNIDVGYQKASTVVSRGDKIRDKISYKYQDNEYIITPKSSDDIIITIEEVESDTFFSINVLNELGESLCKDNYFKNNASITITKHKAGEKLKIHIKQDSGKSSYKMSIF